MAAGDGDADSEAERAETHLRLRAEAELRRALSFPRYRQPRQRGPLFGGRSSLAAMKTARGSMIFTSASAVSSARAIAAPGPLAGLAGRATAGSGRSAPELAQRLAAALATIRRRTTLRLWRLRAQFSLPRRPPRAQECLDGVTRLAVVLASAGAISEQVQADVVGDMRKALAARSLIDQAGLVHDWQPSRATPQAAGSVFAIPVGRHTDYESHGRRVRAQLGALIVGAACARLTVTARLLPSAAGQEPDDDERALDLGHCTAVDDRGTRYHAGFSGGCVNYRWAGTFRFHPSLSTGVRWLDVSLPGAATVRIDMNARGPALPTTSVSLPDGAAGRYLDKLTLDTLVVRRALEADSTDEQELVAAASDLLDAGLIAPDSPAVGRLAAAAELLGLELPPRLAGLRADKIPDDWLVLLARWDNQDGPVGTMPLATQLPELEGMRCLITGIESERESASVQVHVRGWSQPVHHGMVRAEWLHWTGRDDGGCLYVAEESHVGSDEDGADVTLLLRPAIRPRARTLTINLTGRTGQVGVTVPLDWRTDG
jgi:hypothetical protein